MTEAGNRGVLVAAVVAGRPLHEVAALADLSVSSVQRRLKDPEVIAEVKQERSRQRQETLAQFSQLRTACVKRLGELVNDADPSIALRAIPLILTTSGRLDLAFDVEQRLAALEEEFDDEDIDDAEDGLEPWEGAAEDVAAGDSAVEPGNGAAGEGAAEDVAAEAGGWCGE